MSDEPQDTDALRAEIARMRALLAATIESIPFDFWARDREGYCFSQNATTRDHWGDLLGKRPEDMPFPAEVIETWLANNRRALAGEIVHGDVEYAVPSGTRYVHNVLAPIRMGEAIVGTLGVNIDVTERRQALLALRESEEKLRIAVEAAGIGLWVWDADSDEIVWDPSMSPIFGTPPGEAPKGRAGYFALVHPDDRARVAGNVAAGMAGAPWEDEYRIIRGDGAVRWVIGKGTVLREAGRTRAVGALIDVTHRKHRDEQLRQAQKLEAIGQLTAGIAHNFNNMLMGILPNLELAAGRATPDLVPFLEHAASSARRAADLVRKLMTYAGHQRPAAHTVVDLGPLVARAVDLCRTTFDRRIAFEQSYEDGACACVDATQTEQAILNVLINTRDALESPRIAAPRVIVSVAVVRAGAAELAARARDHVRVRVSDNGVGMDAETARRIYEPFFTTKDTGKGTGLGLATTHAIVREHAGFITCESAPGAGTTFCLYFPYEAAPADVPEPLPPRAAAGGDETLLVVDDEPEIRRVVALMLREEGYSVREAASGDEALALLVQGELASKVELILLDVSMPGLSRHDLRRRLRETTSARVVYLTGYALDAADAPPGDVVIEKPVSRDRLLSTIRRALDA